MIVDAGRIGLSRDRVWQLTIREVFQEFAIAAARRRDEFDRDTVHAYQTVRIWVETKAKKRMPKLATLLSSQKKAGGQKQTVAQMRAALTVISQQFGLTIRKGGKRVG